MAAAFLRSLLFLLVSKCIVVEGLPVPSPQHKAPGDRAELEQLQEAARSFREEREVCPVLSIKPGVPSLRGTLVLYNSFSLPSACVTEPASSCLALCFCGCGMRSPTRLGVLGALEGESQGEEWQGFFTALFSFHDSKDVLEGHAGRVLGAWPCSPHLRATHGRASQAAC